MAVRGELHAAIEARGQVLHEIPRVAPVTVTYRPTRDEFGVRAHRHPSPDLPGDPAGLLVLGGVLVLLRAEGPDLITLDALAGEVAEDANLVVSADLADACHAAALEAPFGALAGALGGAALSATTGGLTSQALGRQATQLATASSDPRSSMIDAGGTSAPISSTGSRSHDLALDGLKRIGILVSSMGTLPPRENKTARADKPGGRLSSPPRREQGSVSSPRDRCA